MRLAARSHRIFAVEFFKLLPPRVRNAGPVNCVPVTRITWLQLHRPTRVLSFTQLGRAVDQRRANSCRMAKEVSIAVVETTIDILVELRNDAT